MDLNTEVTVRGVNLGWPVKVKCSDELKCTLCVCVCVSAHISQLVLFLLPSGASCSCCTSDDDTAVVFTLVVFRLLKLKHKLKTDTELINSCPITFP